MSLEENPYPSDESAEFTQAIEEVEAAIASLKDRYRQINEAEQQKKDLEAQLFVGWVSGSVTHAGVGFHASTQPTFILYLVPPTHFFGNNEI